jgi:hypothetical protein
MQSPAVVLLLQLLLPQPYNLLLCCCKLLFQLCDALLQPLNRQDRALVELFIQLLPDRLL